MSHCKSRLLGALVVALACIVVPEVAHGQLLGPTPYLKFADSPFYGGSFSWFYLERFEGASNPYFPETAFTPGWTASAGSRSTQAGFSGDIIDSVDEDDGAINNSSVNGNVQSDSWYYGDANTGVSFTFNPNVLGSLPTSVGLVWTDGNNNIIFQAFDQNGNSLGTLTGNHADNTYHGTTGDDRFYGAVNAGGISKIYIHSTGGGGIEVDHLQYGALSASNVVPEPSAVITLCIATSQIAFYVRRRKRQ